MKLGRVNKLTNVNIFCSSYTLPGNITRLAIITRKTTIKIENLKGKNGEWKRAMKLSDKSPNSR